MTRIQIRSEIEKGVTFVVRAVIVALLVWTATTVADLDKKVAVIDYRLNLMEERG